MEVASQYDNEISRKLAASVNYVLDLGELKDVHEFVSNWERILEEIEQLYHDGRVLQAKTAWQVLQEAHNFHSDQLGSLEKKQQKGVIAAKTALESKSDLVKELTRESELAEKLLRDFSDDSGWEKNSKGENYSVSFAHSKETGLVKLKMEGIVPCNLFQATSLVNEVDLYTYLVPPMMGIGLTHCTEVARTDRLKVLAHAKVALPWPISQRELLLEGFGIDLLDQGMILVVVQDCDKCLGVNLPDLTSPRISIVQGGALIKPISKNSVHLSIISSVDPKLRWIPGPVISWGMKTFSPYVFQYISKTSAEIGINDGCPYKERIENRTQFYGYLRERMKVWEVKSGVDTKLPADHSTRSKSHKKEKKEKVTFTLHKK